MDLNLLDAILSRLRRDGYRLLDLREAVEAFSKARQIPQESIVFTVDDGYSDFEQAAEVFLRYECPVTVFLTTGFIDGTTWLWWDEVEYCCLNAPADEYSVKGSPNVIGLTDDGPQARMATAGWLWEICKLIPELEKRNFIRELAIVTGVSLPPRPPDVYRSLTWEKIRRLEDAGVRFAPHTVTHPILSRVGDEQAELEIVESWRRVRKEVKRPTPILAYPNGNRADFGEREFRIAETAGLAGAVTTEPEYVTSQHFRKARTDRFALPRFPNPENPDGACLVAKGFNRLPSRWR